MIQISVFHCSRYSRVCALCSDPTTKDSARHRLTQQSWVNQYNENESLLFSLSLDLILPFAHPPLVSRRSLAPQEKKTEGWPQLDLPTLLLLYYSRWNSPRGVSQNIVTLSLQQELVSLQQENSIPTPAKSFFTIGDSISRMGHTSRRIPPTYYILYYVPVFFSTCARKYVKTREDEDESIVYQVGITNQEGLLEKCVGSGSRPLSTIRTTA